MLSVCAVISVVLKLARQNYKIPADITVARKKALSLLYLDELSLYRLLLLFLSGYLTCDEDS